MLFVGCLRHYKGLGHLISAMDGLDATLLLAGSGPQEQRLRAIASRSPASDRIHLLGDVAPEQLPSLYAACDVLVWPAINEAYGMALLEAQAAGLPVVAGRSAGVATVVQDRKSGLLTDPGSPTDFASAVRSLVTTTSSRQSMSLEAIGAVAANHGLEAAARQLDEIVKGAAQ